MACILHFLYQFNKKMITLKDMKQYSFVTLMVLLISTTIPFVSLSQNKELTKQEKKEIRKEKKALRKAERKMYDKSIHELAYKALKDMDFVLQASSIQSKRGRIINVSDNLNFILVDNDKATLQLAFKGYGGPNGLGGITLNGRITNKVYTTDKHGNQRLSFNVMGAVLNAEVRINLNASGNYANAQVDAITTGSKIQFRGNLLPRNQSGIYKSGFDI